MENDVPINVLVVVDSSTAVATIGKLLKESSQWSFETIFCDTLQKALNHVAKDCFDVILLDLELSDSCGIETLQIIRQAVIDSPIVVMTAADEGDTLIEAVKQDAQDYLSKEYIMVGPLLSRALYYAVAQWTLSESLHVLATHDELTDVLCHDYFISKLEETFNLARRYKDHFCLILADLDNFKQLNAKYGAGAGDLALSQFASLLSQELRCEDVIGRLGGDEFCLILQRTDLQGATVVLQRLKSKLVSFISPLNGEIIEVGASYGVAELSPVVKSVRQLLEIADRALERDRSDGLTPFTEWPTS